MSHIAQMLGLISIPKRIEMYDVSNYGSQSTVGGMIVWQDGRFKKSDYRRFSFENVFSPDDYKHTYDMINRRLIHLDNGDEGFDVKPDIIFLDGGSGHLGAVYDIISSRGINVFGLVKDRKHRTRAIVSSRGEVDIRTNPAVYKFFTSLQDEVHRYAISYMQSTHKKKMVSGGLKTVKGIGPAKYKALMSKYKTVNAIKNASIEQLTEVAGVNVQLAEEIKKYFDGE